MIWRILIPYSLLKSLIDLFIISLETFEKGHFFFIFGIRLKWILSFKGIHLIITPIICFQPPLSLIIIFVNSLSLESVAYWYICFQVILVPLKVHVSNKASSWIVVPNPNITCVISWLIYNRPNLSANSFTSGGFDE